MKKNDGFSFKKIFKDQLFLIILGIVSFITYLSIFFIKKDEVYLYLSIAVPCVVVVWIGVVSLFIVIKEKNQKETLSIDESEKKEE